MVRIIAEVQVQVWLEGLFFGYGNAYHRKINVSHCHWIIHVATSSFYFWREKEKCWEFDEDAVSSHKGNDLLNSVFLINSWRSKNVVVFSASCSVVSESKPSQRLIFYIVLSEWRYKERGKR